MGIFDRFRRADPAAPSGIRGDSLWARLAGLPRWALAILVAVVVALGYWGVLGAIISDTGADLTLRPGAELLPPGGSVAIGTTAAILRVQVDEKGWTPNDSFLRPTGLLTNMPSFQLGLHGVLVAFTTAIDAAAGGDPDLSEAADALATPPTRGFLHGGFPFIGGSAESNYRDAVDALARYNRALGDSGEPFGDSRQLRLALVAIDRALSEKAVAVDAMVDQGGAAGPAAQFHEVRGTAYAATMLLRGLRDDFGPLIAERQLAGAWAEATESLDAVTMRAPFSIGRGELVEQGYFLLRARDSLRTIAAGAGR